MAHQLYQDSIQTLMISKTYFKKVMDKQEVIMLQDALESLFYFQELMPKLTILKLFFVFQHFSSLCSHCYLFVILFTKHSNITIKEDAHWVIIH